MKSLSESGRAVISAPSLWRRLSVTSSVFLATVALAAQQWQWRSPLPQGNDLYALTYANGRFVAVGDYGTVLSAADGVDWVRHSLESNVT